MPTEEGMASRRGVLKAVGAGIVLGETFTGTVAADVTPTSSENTFMEQIATVLSSTHKYRDVETAKADGYRELGVVPEPPVGHVLEKAEYFDGNEYIGPTKLTEPPALLFYAPTNGEDDSEDLLFAGVEYTVSGDQTRNPPDLFADEDTSSEFTVTEEEGWHRSPAPDVHDVTGLHVWVYLDNPEGVFHKGHPLIAHMISN